ncbi:ABC transporter permease [Propionispora vibrioides]|uniref:Monosaccharide ABC transporter membrane protein, CUT2 family n=1 Tax=Propionispora vibrioides TaxID=112903 RepID=A0A1H8XQE0_9FIRM|nr:ABC transporter permease [Propionispora vibrioides]SEP42037.1 monosaccharide ABC transporter membrane protein, CUT2 family [Propionispora vibrioides]
MQSKTSETGAEKIIYQGLKNLDKYMVYVIFVIVLIFFAVWLGSNFFSVPNIMNITRQTAMISVMAVAMTFVIAAGQIDLSVGAIVALSSLLAALILQATNNVILAVTSSLILGAFIGAVNGFLTTIVRIPSFLTTLGMLCSVQGVAMWLTDTKAVPIMNKTFNFIFGMGMIFGVPILLFWAMIALLIGHFALKYLPYGKKVLAIGGNSISAAYSGINIHKITILVMTFSGMAAAFAGLLYSGRTQTARYTYGIGDELSVIAAVVLGGTSMSGGTGNIIGAVIGSLLLGIINNGLIIGGLNVSQQMMVRGAIIIIAVALNNVEYLKQNIEYIKRNIKELKKNQISRFQ